MVEVRIAAVVGSSRGWLQQQRLAVEVCSVDLWVTFLICWFLKNTNLDLITNYAGIALAKSFLSMYRTKVSDQ